LPAFLAIRYRDLAPRVASLYTISSFSLAGFAYARIDIAINSQRRWREGCDDAKGEHCGIANARRRDMDSSRNR
jgi:hypothetical protein